MISEIIHKEFIRECIQVAYSGLKAGDPPFATLIVLDGKIVVKAHNTSVTQENFLQHGEMNALSMAQKILKKEDFSRAVLYASNEPCPMCSGAIYWSGIRTVVFGSSRSALTKLRKFGINVPCREVLQRGSEPVSVIGPLLEDEVLPLYHEYYDIKR